MSSSERGGSTRSGARGVTTVALLLLLVVGAAVAFWGWQGGGDADRAEVSLPTAAPVTVSEAPDPTRPPPQPVSPAPTEDVERATAAAPTPSPEPARPEPPEPPAAVAGAPVHLTIARGAEVLVDAPIALTQLNEHDELNPPSGVVGWYGPPQWQTVPGELSSHPGVLAGHTTYDGSADVFYRLGEVRAGDRVTIRYGDGQAAVFVADADALSVPKNDVTDKAATDYAWVWSLPEPGRKISLFSCDLAQGRDLTGHSLNNWVVQATRTE